MPETDFIAIALGVIGGLAIFLFGMQQMSRALQAAAGERLRRILQRLTGNRISAVLTGAGVTAAANSSSVTTVILIGFMTAGLMNLQQSIGVLLGANVGSTVTAQLIAFKVTALYALLVAIGFGLQLAKKPLLQHLGDLTFGLGLIFLGMDLMGSATTPLREWQPFLDAMQQIAHPAIGILAGALVTAAIQSSAATTGMIIVLASSGSISLSAGISIALGANIGTCVTAVLAALGKPRAAVQTAAAHVIINVLGVLIWLPFLGQFAELVTWLSPKPPENIANTEQLAWAVPRQIANAHTLFNIGNAILFLPFTGALAWLILRVIPDQALPAANDIDLLIEDYPDNTDIDMMQTELAHQKIFHGTCAILRSLNEEKLSAEHEQQISTFEQQAIALLNHVRETQRRTEDNAIISRGEGVLLATKEVLTILDMLVLNWLPTITQARNAQLQSSSETRTRMRTLFRQAIDIWSHSWDLYQEKTDLSRADLQQLRHDFRQAETDFRHYLNERLRSDEPNRIEIFRLESQIIDTFRLIIESGRRITKINLAPNPATSVHIAAATNSAKSSSQDIPNTVAPSEEQE